jgi:hypothetical protein
MKLERKVNLGGFQSMAFQSSEHGSVQECARDLIAQMNPMSAIYPTVRGVVEELRKAYNVT